MTRALVRTRIKFCGLTRAGDVRLAGELGVDAIGLIFTEASPRRVGLEEARILREALAPLVDVVALFRDNSPAEVRTAILHARPTLLQFQGCEEDAFCRRFNLPYIKGISSKGPDAGRHGRALHSRYPHAVGFVLDGYPPCQPGATTQRGAIDTVPEDMSKPYVLAGGLNPGNVFDAVRSGRPWGVHVASGIEVEPGIKDGALMRRFVEEVRRADCAEGIDDGGDAACQACGRG